MKKVLGMGNSLVDIMTRLETDETLEHFSLPKGSMQLVDEAVINDIKNGTGHLQRDLASGGSAANTIHGLANLYIGTGFIGKVGSDSLGSFFRNDMLSCGIEPKLMLGTASTGTAIALVSPDSERTFAVHLGAAIELSADDLSADLFTGYDYFHIEGYLVQNHDLLLKGLQYAKKAGLKISLDLASYNVVEANLDFLRSVVREYVDIVFANEEEAKAFTGLDPEEAVERIGSQAEIAIVKTGKNGSLVKHGQSLHQISAIPSNCIDTTGAGDLYAAGFLFGLINNYPIDRCGQIGSVLAGKVIEVIGAKIKAPVWTDLREMILKEK